MKTPSSKDLSPQAQAETKHTPICSCPGHEADCVVLGRINAELLAALKAIYEYGSIREAERIAIEAYAKATGELP